MKERLIYLVIAFAALFTALSTIPAEAKNLSMEPWEKAIETDRKKSGGSADKYEMVATVTAYCYCNRCCGKWAKNRPGGIVYTASGAMAEAGVTIAVDPAIIPYGAHVLIDGHEYIAQDTGVSGKWIDIYCTSHKEALNIGLSTKTVCWWVD